MAIPTTLPLSMSTIKTELGLSGSQSLTACFAAATGTFNATYEGSKDRVTNFRGYNHTCVAGLTSTNFYPTATTSGSACGPVGGEQVRYHDGAAADPANGDKMYVDSGGCTVMNGGGSWFAFRNGANFWKLTVSSTGIVGSKTACP